MNLLVLSPFVPYPPDQGGKIRVFNLVRQLAVRHRVTLACLTERAAPDPGPLADWCARVVTVPRPPAFAMDLGHFLAGRQPFNCRRFASPAFRRTLRRLAAERFDAVLVEFSYLWQYAGLFPGVPLLLDAHNLEYRIVAQLGAACGNPLRRALYGVEARRLRRFEELAWRECTRCLAVSELERVEIVAAVGDPGKVVTIPNGVDLARFPFQRRPAAGRLLFLGGLEYGPNLDAARWLLREIWPLVRERLPGAELDLVGRRLELLDGLPADGVICHANVPDVRPWFESAAALLVSLRQGAGTRLKILEALAAGLPVVTTAKGCEGLPVRDGEQLLVADSAADFAAALARLATEPNLAAGLAAAGRQLVEERYAWEQVTATLEGLLATVTGVPR